MTEVGGTPEETEAPVLPAGTRLGKYEIGRPLGSGGMGAVYEATHTEIGKRVAIKVLSPAIAAIPGTRARFLREAQLTSKIRHPNIVDVADMGNDGGQTYIVMELLAGEDLAQRLQRGGPLSPAELADVMLPVCAAVVAAHRAGVTHRDLKPQNIFLARGPHGVHPKVLDFGISKGQDTVGAGTLTGTGSIIGTPYYFAPEQILDARAAGPGTDQYALGVIMYECLTGHRPYDAETLFIVFQAIVNGSPVPLRTHRPDLSPGLEAVVLQAMHVDPKRRFSSTDGLGLALLPFASVRQRSIWEDAFDGIAPGEVNPSAPAAGPVSWPPAAMTPPPPAAMTPRLSAVVTPPAPGLRTPQPRSAMTPPPTASVAYPSARPAGGKRVAIGLAVAAAVAGGAWLALRGSADQPAQIASPRPAPVAPSPAPPTAVTPPAPAAPAAVTPPAPAAVPALPVAPAAVREPPAAPSRPARPPAPARARARPAKAPAAPGPRALNPNAAPVVD